MFLRNQSLAVLLFSVTFPTAVVASTVVFSEAVRAVVPSNQIVKVRGVAEKIIVSDRVDWNIAVQYIAKDRGAAYARVDETVDRALDYLRQKGVPTSAIQVSGPELEEKTQRLILDKLGNTRLERLGWEVTRTLHLRSLADLDLVESLASQLESDLVREGWPIPPSAPYYSSTQSSSELKPELLREAARNAFERATIVADSSGSKLGALKAARQGAFEGIAEDGSVGGLSRHHRVRALVTVDYALSGR